MTTRDLKENLTATAEAAKETTVAAIEAAVEVGRTVQARAKAEASETLETLRDAAGEGAGAARDTLVGAADRLARALKAEARATDGVPARLLNGMAGGVSTATDGLRGRTLGDLVADAQGYARRHPGTFAVGAAVAGFALARFLGASASRRTAEARAAEVTDRIYHDAARRAVDLRAADPHAADSHGRAHGGGTQG